MLGICIKVKEQTITYSGRWIPGWKLQKAVSGVAETDSIQERGNDYRTVLEMHGFNGEKVAIQWKRVNNFLETSLDSEMKGKCTGIRTVSMKAPHTLSLSQTTRHTACENNEMHGFVSKHFNRW